MKRFVLLLQLYLIATLASYGTNKTYKDAFICGVFYGNPSEITVLEKDGFTENASTYKFDEQGALTYYDGSVKNLVRDEKGRLKGFDTVTASYIVEWNQYDIPYKIRHRSLMTKLVTDEFIDYNYTCNYVNDHFCRTQEKRTTPLSKKGRKENITLAVAMFQNPSFDEYGNVKFQVRHYTEFSGLDIADNTILTTINYWPDRMTDIGDTSQRKNTFKKLIRTPGGFAYNPENKRNLVQQLFYDYVNQSGLQRIARQHRDVYKGSSNKYYEIPYDIFYYATVGGELDNADIYFEFRGTEHEIKELEKEFLQHLNTLGMNMISDGKEHRSSSEITIAQDNKKKLTINKARTTIQKESGHDKALLRLSINYRESKVK